MDLELKVAKLAKVSVDLAKGLEAQVVLNVLMIEMLKNAEARIHALEESVGMHVPRPQLVPLRGMAFSPAGGNAAGVPGFPKDAA